jgi:hypothetical protein
MLQGTFFMKMPWEDIFIRFHMRVSRRFRSATVSSILDMDYGLSEYQSILYGMQYQSMHFTVSALLPRYLEKSILL